MTADYFVRYLPFPARVGAVVVPNDDGSFDIYISSRLSDEAQKERLAHELSHIRADHFYRPIPVALAEAEARGVSSGPRSPAVAEEVSPPVSPSAAPSPADEWLLSWQKAMAWAEEMMKQHSWPDAG